MEGWLGFSKVALSLNEGMTPKLIQTVLNSALMLVLYERLSKFFLKLIHFLTTHLSFANLLKR